MVTYKVKEQQQVRRVIEGDRLGAQAEMDMLAQNGWAIIHTMILDNDLRTMTATVVKDVGAPVEWTGDPVDDEVVL